MRKILNKFKWLLFFASGFMMSVPGVASALVTTHHASDITLQSESFVAEGRIGDLSGAATFELDIGATTSAPAQTANYNWANGYAHPFSLTYNNITNIVSFTVGDVTLTYSPSQVSTDIYIRTRAVNADTSIIINNLVLDGVPVNDTSSAANPGNGIEILQISGGTLSDGFTLTGKSTMTWTGSPPTQSRLAYQITIADGRADMNINKTVFPDPASVGQNLTYTINATNNGPSTANGVTITDVLPAGVTLIFATQSHGTCSGTTTVICNITSLANGETATVTVVVTPTTAGTITNQATVSANETDPDTGNNTVSLLTTVNSSADISITKSDSPDPVVAGDSLLYTINVNNNGPGSATNVTVTDVLHANVTYVSATPSQGTCSGTITVSCNLGTLANAASASVMIVVTPTVVGTIDNTVTVAADEDDPDLSNNTSLTEYTTVIAASSGDADLSVIKTDAPDPVLQVGDNVTYTITVTNNGPGTATGVTVTDTLNSLTYVSHTTTQGTCTGTTTVTCTLGTLANGSSATITIVAGTNPPTGNIANTATVTGNEDTNIENNSATANTNVGDVSRIIYLSTRSKVETGDNRMIGGFIVEGSLPKTLLIRARGPSMTGVSGVLANPYIRLFSHDPLVNDYIAQNDNWGEQSDPLCAQKGYVCGSAADIINGGWSLCPVGDSTCDTESAVLITLPPGTYSTVMSGIGGTTGVGLVQLLDVDTSTEPKLSYISTRARVLTGFDRMIGGFIIGAGGGDKQVFIRARGPSMTGVSGVLANPYIRLFSHDPLVNDYIAQNDNWGDQSDPLCAEKGYVCGSSSDIINGGLALCPVGDPTCDTESAILITLPPGTYSAVMSGVGGTTGVGLVQISDVVQ